MTFIAHLADLHLGYRQYGLIERENDIYEAFEEAIDKIIVEHAKIVIISGDLFNSPRPPIRALYHIKRNLEKLKSQGVDVFCILGDHDLPRRAGEYSPIMLFKDELLHHVDRKIVERKLDGNTFIITGVDKAPVTASGRLRELVEELSKRIQAKPGKRIFVAHIPVHGISGEFCLDDLPAGYDYYALGHEHIRKLLPKGSGLAAYPGSIDILARDEIAEWKTEGKGFYLVDLSGSEPVVHKINLDSTRPQEIFRVTLKEAVEKVSTWMADQRKAPIIHLLIRDREFDPRTIYEIVEELRRQGALEVRYRRGEPEIGETFASIAHLDISKFNIEELIARIAQDSGLSEEEAKLAVQIYNEFRKGRIDALAELISNKASEVRKTDS